MGKDFNLIEAYLLWSSIYHGLYSAFHIWVAYEEFLNKRLVSKSSCRKSLECSIWYISIAFVSSLGLIKYSFDGNTIQTIQTWSISKGVQLMDFLIMNFNIIRILSSLIVSCFIPDPVK